jgi:mannose-6-phosphate isomerase-like protein (cupin superfamily)
MSDAAWQVFTLDELAKRPATEGPSFTEFVSAAGLSGAVYRLPAGSRDLQAPHLEDELYFVLSGRAQLRVGGEKRAIAPGNVLFVRATLEHSFFDIEEDLTVIVVFGSPGT